MSDRAWFLATAAVCCAVTGMWIAALVFAGVAIAS